LIFWQCERAKKPKTQVIMQLYALNDSGHPVFVKHALKHKDYCCLECQGLVRVRSGFHRQPHFYHIQSTPSCRLNGKGLVHLQVQWAIFNQLPDGEAALEYRLPSIRRIADVAWLSKKLVFEVQCASISAKEIAERNRDYACMGWQVVWILHDRRYNQRFLSAAEAYLAPFSHYFSNIDDQGNGMIYDQLDRWSQGKRHCFASHLPIQLSEPMPPTLSKIEVERLRGIERGCSWTTGFRGDVVDLSQQELSHSMNEAWAQAFAFDRALKHSSSWKMKIFQKVKHLYQLFFQLILERLSMPK
jgi:competence protein CoiA